MIILYSYIYRKMYNCVKKYTAVVTYALRSLYLLSNFYELCEPSSSHVGPVPTGLGVCPHHGPWAHVAASWFIELVKLVKSV